MTTKKDVAPVQEPKGKTIPMNEVKNAVPAETIKAQEPTAEELKKQIEQLQKKLSAIPQDLEKRIEYFNHKKELIRRLSRLDVDSETLNSHLDKLSEIAAANEFETEEYYLNIEAGAQYSKKAIYTLKNPVVIGELITFILGRVDAKREELKKAIEA